jgi:hypothetical protein
MTPWHLREVDETHGFLFLWGLLPRCPASVSMIRVQRLAERDNLSGASGGSHIHVLITLLCTLRAWRALLHRNDPQDMECATILALIHAGSGAGPMCNVS